MAPENHAVHQNKALENISVKYAPSEYVANRLIPAIPVMKESDKYYVFNRDSESIPQTLRANGSESRRASYSMSTSTYALQQHSLHDVITDRDRANADKALKLDIDTTEILTDRLLKRQEKECADMIQSTANWNNYTTLSASVAWALNTTASNPITQADSGASVVIQRSNKPATIMVMDDITFRGVKEHDSVIDRVKYTSPDSVSEGLLARMFNIKEVLVARATYASSEEGLWTVTGQAFIWTNCVWMGYFDPTPGLKKMSAAYKFVSTLYGNPYTVKKWRDEAKEGDMIEVNSMFQYKPVATSCAYLFVDTA